MLIFLRRLGGDSRGPEPGRNLTQPKFDTKFDTFDTGGPGGLLDLTQGHPAVGGKHIEKKIASREKVQEKWW